MGDSLNGRRTKPNGRQETHFMPCVFAVVNRMGDGITEWAKINNQSTKSAAHSVRNILEDFSPFSDRMGESSTEWTKIAPNGRIITEWANHRMG